MKDEYEDIPVYVVLDGFGIGIGNPLSSCPQNDPVSLLCAITHNRVEVDDWVLALHQFEDILLAVRHIIETHGGVEVMAPTQLHLGLATFVCSTPSDINA